MGVIVWDPSEGLNLGTYDVEVDPINVTITATYIPDEEDTFDDDYVSSIELIDYPGIDKITATVDNNSINISGIVPISIFDRYKITYVDKGSSDKIMEPVISDIGDVPDRKEVFYVDVDDRRSLTYFLHFRAITRNGAESNRTYTLEVRQSWSMIKNWLADYFENRY